MHVASRAAALRPAARLTAYTLVLCTVLAVWLAATASAGVIPTDRGPVRGAQTPAVNKYLGIPYAAPPVGELRWAPPQPVARWHGPRDATRFGNHCPQPASHFGTASTTEDCLYLNVFTPSKGGKGQTKDLPVMFWIHGGGLAVGESDDYDPTRLVKQGTVVVTINYRLGWLGFLAQKGLSAGSGYAASGNYGLMDQQSALRWVQRNIRKFGGDPDNVTIFGQSAGGLSVHSQLASPRAAGLFDRAISQSGAYALTFPSLSQAEGNGSTFAQDSGCSDETVACLRSLPVETVLANQPTTEGSVLPNLDGKVLTQSPKDAFQSGQFNRVPVTEGTTHDEFSIFYALNVELSFGAEIPPFLYSLVVRSLLQAVGSSASPDDVIARYPVASYQNSVGQAVTAFGTDALFACPARRAAALLSQHVPTYQYELKDPDVPQPFVTEPVSIPYKAYHAADLLFLFDSETFGGEFGGHAPFTSAEESLAAAMVRYWTQFARAGDPNGPVTPNWPAYTPATDLHQSLEPPTPRTDAAFATDHQCSFWDSL